MTVKKYVNLLLIYIKYKIIPNWTSGFRKNQTKLKNATV